ISRRVRAVEAAGGDEQQRSEYGQRRGVGSLGFRHPLHLTGRRPAWVLCRSGHNMCLIRYTVHLPCPKTDSRVIRVVGRPVGDTSLMKETAMTMKRLIGDGMTSLVLVSVGVLSAYPAMADTSKATYDYYPTLERFEQLVALRLIEHSYEGRKVRRCKCYTVWPG